MPAPVRLSYGATTKILHWLVFLLLIMQFLVGWLMPEIRSGVTPGNAMTIHISFGVTILIVIVARIIWRLTHPVSPVDSLPHWQRVISQRVHWLLDATLLGTGLSGWLFESARGWGIYLFELIPLPRLVAQGSSFGQTVGALHTTLTWVLLALVAVHVAAALAHFFIYKDGVLQRMLAAA